MNDVAIQQVSLKNHNVEQPKILHFVSIVDNKKRNFFIGISKPIIENGVLNIKGVFTEGTESSVKKSALNILNEAGDENIVSVMFPLNNVNYIQNLNYKVK